MPSHRNPIEGVYCTAAPTHMGIRAQGNIVEGWECAAIYIGGANADAGWRWKGLGRWGRAHYWPLGEMMWSHFTGSVSRLHKKIVLQQCSPPEASDWPRLQCSLNRLDLSSMPGWEVLLSLVNAEHSNWNCASVKPCNWTQLRTIMQLPSTLQLGVFKLQLCAIMQKSTNDPPAPGYCSAMPLNWRRESNPGELYCN